MKYASGSLPCTKVTLNYNTVVIPQWYIIDHIIWSIYRITINTRHVQGEGEYLQVEVDG